MIDVLALPLAEAKAKLEQEKVTIKVVRSEPEYRRFGPVSAKSIEYVVRQHWLDNHNVILTTVLKYRKEVLGNGIEN
jgi:hypothetical protein